MSKSGEGVRSEVVRVLLEADEPLRSCDIAVRCGAHSREVCTSVAAIMRGATKIGGKLERTKVDGKMWYWVIRDENVPAKIAKIRAPKHKIELPENIGRGWFNPLTGATGSKLGV